VAAVFRHTDGMAAGFQRGTNDAPYRRLIIYNKNRRHGFRLPDR